MTTTKQTALQTVIAEALLDLQKFKIAAAQYVNSQKSPQAQQTTYTLYDWYKATFK